MKTVLMRQADMLHALLTNQLIHQAVHALLIHPPQAGWSLVGRNAATI